MDSQPGRSHRRTRRRKLAASPSPSASGPTSAQKSAVRREGTAPELLLRRALVAHGLRGYRLNLHSLPGCPDAAFTRWKVAVFVDGMFWHGHPSKFQPGRSGEYWDRKIARNRERDNRVTQQLRDLGWLVLRFWEFDLQDNPNACVDRVRSALASQGHTTPPRL